MKIRPVILVILFSLRFSSCNIVSPGQPGNEPTATPEQPVIAPTITKGPSGIEPTTTPEIFIPLPADLLAFESVRTRLAGELGVDSLKISLVDVTPVDWPDSCLELPTLGEMCAQMVTPGFRVRVQVGKTIYEFHTDLEAKDIRQVK